MPTKRYSVEQIVAKLREAREASGSKRPTRPFDRPGTPCHEPRTEQTATPQTSAAAMNAPQCLGCGVRSPRRISDT
jgi:hypothetical protein